MRNRWGNSHHHSGSSPSPLLVLLLFHLISPKTMRGLAERRGSGQKPRSFCGSNTTVPRAPPQGSCVGWGGSDPDRRGEAGLDSGAPRRSRATFSVFSGCPVVKSLPEGPGRGSGARHLPPPSGSGLPCRPQPPPCVQTPCAESGATWSIAPLVPPSPCWSPHSRVAGAAPPADGCCQPSILGSAPLPTHPLLGLSNSLERQWDVAEVPPLVACPNSHPRPWAALPRPHPQGACLMTGLSLGGCGACGPGG